MTLPVLCRDAWGGTPPGPGLQPHRIERLTLHHSGVVLGDNRLTPSRLRQHETYHRDAGWPDIAYHVAVDRRGHTYELRDPGARGDTFTNYDPTGHFLVLAEGNFDEEQPTDEQLEGCAQVLAHAAGLFGVSPATLTGHRDHADTACPGAALYAALPRIRARVEELRHEGGVETVTVCGPEGDALVDAIEAGRR